MRAQIRRVVAIACLVCLGVSCAPAQTQPTPTATSVPAHQPSSSPGVALPPDTNPTMGQGRNFEDEWEDLIAKAQQEGELVVIMGAGSSVRDRPILQAFSEKFGIRIVASTGSGSASADRMLAERQRGRYSVDIVQTGPTSIARLLEAGALAPMMDLLIHPEVLDRSAGWWFQEFLWSAGMDPGYSASYFIELNYNYNCIFYNTRNVSPAVLNSIQSNHDFLRPEFDGRLGGHDLLRGDLGVGYGVTAYLVNNVGREWVVAFIERVEWLPVDATREIEDGLALGRWDFAFPSGVSCHNMRDMEALGLPVAELKRTLSEGTNAQIGGALAVADRAPHPNAAKLFANWWYSRDGQTAYHELTNSSAVRPSLRSDVPIGKADQRQFEALQRIDALGLQFELFEDVTAGEEAQAFIRSLYAERGLLGY